MSDTPNNDSGDGSQGEQPQGGQPQSGQSAGGQSPGGQPTGGQPQGGQAPQGQAAGGPPQGQPPQGQAPQGGTQPQGQAPQGQTQRAPVNTGPSVGDIFSRKDTLDQIKLGVVLYAIVGFGMGLGLFGLGTAFSNPSSLSGAFQAAGIIAGGFAIPIAVSAVMGALIGRQQSEELSDVEETLVFATAGVTSAVGALVVYILSILLLGLGSGNISFNNMIIPMITTALGAAVISVATVWAEENLLGPSGTPPQGPQQY